MAVNPKKARRKGLAWSKRYGAEVLDCSTRAVDKLIATGKLEVVDVLGVEKLKPASVLALKQELGMVEAAE